MSDDSKRAEELRRIMDAPDASVLLSAESTLPAMSTRTLVEYEEGTYESCSACDGRGLIGSHLCPACSGKCIVPHECSA